MESTGVYWIPLYDLLEERGIEVFLVNAQRIKGVPGRKSDVLDCQWLQHLHSYGLLRRSFRPDADSLKLRTYLRHRGTLVDARSSLVQQMQKALTQSNVQLHQVVTDITGETGMQLPSTPTLVISWLSVANIERSTCSCCVTLWSSTTPTVPSSPTATRSSNSSCSSSCTSIAPIFSSCRITGGKAKPIRRPASAHRVAEILRMAAMNAGRTTSAFGGFYRRLAMRAGKGKAIVALAAKLARLIYAMIKNRSQFEHGGAAAYEARYQARVVRNLQRRAQDLGYQLVPAA